MNSMNKLRIRTSNWADELKQYPISIENKNQLANSKKIQCVISHFWLVKTKHQPLNSTFKFNQQHFGSFKQLQTNANLINERYQSRMRLRDWFKGINTMNKSAIVTSNWADELKQHPTSILEKWSNWSSQRFIVLLTISDWLKPNINHWIQRLSSINNI